MGAGRAEFYNPAGAVRAGEMGGAAVVALGGRWIRLSCCCNKSLLFAKSVLCVCASPPRERRLGLQVATGRNWPPARGRGQGPGGAARRRAQREGMKCRRCSFGNFRPLGSPFPAPTLNSCHSRWSAWGDRDGLPASLLAQACPSLVLCRRDPWPPAAYAHGPRFDPGGPPEPAAGGRAARHRAAARGQSPWRRHFGVHHRQCHLRGLRAIGELRVSGGGAARCRGRGGTGLRLCVFQSVSVGLVALLASRNLLRPQLVRGDFWSFNETASSQESGGSLYL